MSELSLDSIVVPANFNILYLEDTVLFQKKMIESIKGVGFTKELRVAGTVKDALLELNKSKPDFILSDWNLPDGNGLEFLLSVRANKAFDGVPFLMVTTVDDINNILEAVNSGADGYIVKPWVDSDLIEKIAFAVDKRRND